MFVHACERVCWLSGRRNGRGESWVLVMSRLNLVPFPISKQCCLAVLMVCSLTTMQFSPLRVYIDRTHIQHINSC